MNLTVAYITARKNSRFEEWFLPSLARQVGDDKPQIIKIDRFADEAKETVIQGFSVLIHPPKPSVWSGPYKKTKVDWFDVANARNTAICLCKTSHIALMDDLTFLMPNYWQAAKEAAKLTDTITIGAYQKVRNLTVSDVSLAYDSPASGIDNRMSIMRENKGPCKGDWLYGYAVAPVEAFLSVDGYPESICGGLGFEDVICGIVLQNAGWKFIYDKALMAIESEEAHFEEPPSRRESFSKGPHDRDDKAWRALNIAKVSKTFDNGFGEGGIRALRERILSGEPFPIKGTPEHEWHTGKLLSDL